MCASMKHHLTRRHFLASTATVAAALSAPFGLQMKKSHAAEAAAAPGFRTKLRKAMIISRPTEDDFKKLQDAGFDGVEGGVISPQEAEKCRAAAEKVGMRVHAVLRGWAEFNHPDRSQVEQSYAVTEASLRAAQAFGADAVLLVPCRIGGVRMPRPWEFHIDFNENNGHLRAVVPGDNAPFAEYIRAHNHAIDTSREMVKRLIPLAEETKVVIALENVWNNLWVTPEVFAHFVRSFQSPWVKAYYDIGNHVKYAPSEQWILALGDLIAKCHVKDFKLNPSDPNGEGQFVNIRDGSVRWPVVRQALERVGYDGWMTIEGGDLSLKEHSERLDLIVAGK
jgi:L-ribulose-5-phosphate 3-epimerase